MRSYLVSSASLDLEESRTAGVPTKSHWHADAKIKVVFEDRKALEEC